MDVSVIDINELENYPMFYDINKLIYKDWQLNFKLNSKLNLVNASMVFMVIEDEVCISRAILYKSPYKNTCFIGAFESLENLEAVRLLFDKINEFAKLNGLQKMIGPMDGNTWESYRFPVIKEANFIGEPIYALYYNLLWKQLGWSVEETYYSLDVDIKKEATNSNYDFTIRSIDLKNLEDDLKKVYPIVINAFRSNPYFQELTEIEFIEKYLSLKPFMQPQWVKVAENNDGEIICLVFAYINPINPNELIFKTSARAEGDEYKGVGEACAKHIHAEAYKHGINKVVHALMVNNNGGNKVTKKHFDNTLRNEYHLYGMEVK